MSKMGTSWRKSWAVGIENRMTAKNEKERPVEPDGQAFSSNAKESLIKKAPSVPRAKTPRGMAKQTTKHSITKGTLDSQVSAAGVL